MAFEKIKKNIFLPTMVAQQLKKSQVTQLMQVYFLDQSYYERLKR